MIGFKPFSKYYQLLLFGIRMNLFKKILLMTTLSICLLPTVSYSAASIKVVVAPSAGSSGLLYKSLLPSMIYTPCLSAADPTKIFGFADYIAPATVSTVKGTTIKSFFDNFAITVSGSNADENKDGIYDYDLYFFIVNPAAPGVVPAVLPAITNSQFFAFRKGFVNTGGSVTLKENSSTLAPAVGPATPNDVYLLSEEFSTSAIKESIMGGDLSFDAYTLPQGTWLAVAILAERTLLNFQDPSTFIAWDVVPFVLGTPWATTIGPSGTGTCN